MFINFQFLSQEEERREKKVIFVSLKGNKQSKKFKDITLIEPDKKSWQKMLHNNLDWTSVYWWVLQIKTQFGFVTKH